MNLTQLRKHHWHGRKQVNITKNVSFFSTLLQEMELKANLFDEKSQKF